MKVPYISEELIQFLDNAYPERSAEISWSDKEVWIKAGERRVVRKLIQMQKDQLERAMIQKKE